MKIMNLNCHNSGLFQWQVVIRSVILAGFLLPANIIAQDETNLSNNLVKYLGVYTMNIYEKKPKGLEQFQNFEIKEFTDQNIDNPQIDRDGMTFIDGELEVVDGIIFKFKKAFLKTRANGKYEDFEFKTFRIKGISYSFKGKFLERAVQEIKGGSYTKIRGVLCKYKNGKKLTSAEIPFAEFAIL